MRPTRLLLVAGVLVWGLSGVPTLGTLARADVSWGQLAAWLAFGGAFLVEFVRPAADFRWSLLVQALSAVSLMWLSGAPTGRAMLLVVVAGQLPVLFSVRVCVVWVAAQTVVGFGPQAWTAGVAGAAAPALAYFAFQLFALGTSTLAEGERRAREELARAKGRLEAIQERLAETTREAERLRIARELHDALGHQLTALALDLEVARHLATGEGVAPVQRARALASSLMASVRDAVTELREDAGPDLVLGLQSLARQDGRPRVEVTCPRTVDAVPQPVRAALIRVAQELVTNTTKHAKASALRLSLRHTDTEWILLGEDDGVGADRVCAGYGLSGMRERVEGLGGRVAIETSRGRGFSVTVVIPKAAAA